MSWVLNPNKAGLFEGSFSGRGGESIYSTPQKTKNHGFTLFLQDPFFKKPQGGAKLTSLQSFSLYLEGTFFKKSQKRVQIDPPAVLGLKINSSADSFKEVDLND